MTARALGAVFAGGAVGGTVRTVLVELVGSGDGWPWVTFAVNLVGSALLAVVLVSWRRFGLALGTGLCGGLTTFATMQLELVQMVARGAVGLAVGYGAASIVGGLVVVAGIWRSAAWWQERRV